LPKPQGHDIHRTRGHWSSSMCRTRKKAIGWPSFGQCHAWFSVLKRGPLGSAASQPSERRRAGGCGASISMIDSPVDGPRQQPKPTFAIRGARMDGVCRTGWAHDGKRSTVKAPWVYHLSTPALSFASTSIATSLRSVDWLSTVNRAPIAEHTCLSQAGHTGSPPPPPTGRARAPLATAVADSEAGQATATNHRIGIAACDEIAAAPISKQDDTCQSPSSSLRPWRSAHHAMRSGDAMCKPGKHASTR